MCKGYRALPEFHARPDNAEAAAQRDPPDGAPQRVVLASAAP